MLCQPDLNQIIFPFKRMETKRVAFCRCLKIPSFNLEVGKFVFQAEYNETNHLIADGNNPHWIYTYIYTCTYIFKFTQVLVLLHYIWRSRLYFFFAAAAVVYARLNLSC